MLELLWLNIEKTCNFIFVSLKYVVVRIDRVCINVKPFYSRCPYRFLIGTNSFKKKLTICCVGYHSWIQDQCADWEIRNNIIASCCISACNSHT